jgi:FkbH-like protein
MRRPEFGWLPADPGWNSRIKALEQQGKVGWAELAQLANYRIDLLQTERLDRLLQRFYAHAPPKELATRPVRLALLSSSTSSHLLAGLRVGALRHGLWLACYEPDYGQYWQELLNESSALYRFQPDIVLFAFDAHHLVSGLSPPGDAKHGESAINEALDRLRTLWNFARERMHAQVLQQTALPVLPSLLGSNEHAMPGAPAAFLLELNAKLREIAGQESVSLVSVDTWATRHGLDAWHDPVWWYRGKQEISPAAAPFYGELVGRLLAAMQGRSRKCLVLDLDHTLWGGVVGDDGVEGLVLGQGSALGEAYLAFQDYVRALSERGVILAVCSKNDADLARAPFELHSEMRLKLSDISCFVANWNDKPTNISEIAKQLNIGLDAIVFVDDNPFERELVRKELPLVAVPEVPDDPALYADCLAQSGYFEAIAITAEDRVRTKQYHANRERALLRESATDLDSYLRSLEMRLLWRRFDAIGLQRITQLINKTNQFNLTTRRYTEEEVRMMMQDPNVIGLQFRLLDRFGDNGIIAVVIGRLQENGELYLDTWLMSCRVLGRGVEDATLNVLASVANRLGVRRLLGEYRPSSRNGMVAKHYPRLGFAPVAGNESGTARFALALSDYVPRQTHIAIEEE